MKILVNRNIKLLFSRLLLCMVLFLFLSLIPVAQAPYFCLLGMGVGILGICYQYFKEQNKLMEQAVKQIQGYISGNRNGPIECNDEGELYRLFHEVNSLISILNAHVEHEGQGKQFLKNTISDISHQLKTPLAALNVYNGIIQEEAEELPVVKEFALRSEEELDRIETLVQNLLKITRLDAGAIVMEKSTEYVGEMMEAVKRSFSFRAEQEHKEIDLSGDKDITFLCDKSWFLEAIGNLVKNSLDHTKEGGNIQIEWKQLGSVLRITIKDNGSGIHPEDLYHIFKRFYRSRYSKDTKGIGLGLSLAKSIVEKHNGTIRADSEPGMGAAFVMDFFQPTKL